jgi:hypothetical protein
MKLLRFAWCVMLLIGVAACDPAKSPAAPSSATPTSLGSVVADQSGGGAGDAQAPSPARPAQNDRAGQSTSSTRDDGGDADREDSGDDHHGRTAGVSARLEARPSSIQAGQSSTLTWRTTNATSATLDGASVSLRGSRIVSPIVTTMYTLVASGPGGSKTVTATVTVGGTPPPLPKPVATLVANPTAIQTSQSSMLTWTSTNAASVTLDGASVPQNGSQSVSPAATHAYSLVATGAGGTTTLTATVTVTAVSAGLTYTRDIQPILAANCTRCHSVSSPAAGVNLSSYAAVLAVADARERQFAPRDVHAGRRIDEWLPDVRRDGRDAG